MAGPRSARPRTRCPRASAPGGAEAGIRLARAPANPSFLSGSFRAVVFARVKGGVRLVRTFSVVPPAETDEKGDNMSERYDLVVIGAGPAGEKGAAQAAYFGKRVAVVDRLPRPGGAPVASTGIPTKTLRETALYITGFRNRDVYGLSLELDPEVALQRLMTRKSEVATTMAKAVDENLKRHGIRFIQGEARLGPGRIVRVSVDGEELTLEGEIVLLATGSRPLRPPSVPFEDLDVHDSGEVLRPEQALFAAGRAGNTEGLGMEELGVELDARGRVVVDKTFRTSAKGIYAAGDVIGPPALASVSMEQGRVAVCHAFGIPFKETVDPLPPFAVFSIPEVAMVGPTEEAARTQGVEHEVGKGWFAENTKATISGFTEGLVKLVFRRGDRTLLGVHILGDDASELIHTGQAVIHRGGTIDQFIHATFCAPTRSEAYKYAAYDGLQRLSGGSIGRVEHPDDQRQARSETGA